MNRVEGILGVVARAMKKQFPDDYFKRCAYAAWATRALLWDDGFEATLAGGNFVAFVVTPGGEKGGVQGFGYNPTQCAHFWVEAKNRILDLGPHFLPGGSNFPVLAMPAAAWDIAKPLPHYLRYQTLQRFPPNAVMSADPDINRRMRDFIDHCRVQIVTEEALLGFPTWLLSSPSALQRAINRRDSWARHAAIFHTRAANWPLPF